MYIQIKNPWRLLLFILYMYQNICIYRCKNSVEIYKNWFICVIRWFKSVGYINIRGSVQTHRRPQQNGFYGYYRHGISYGWYIGCVTWSYEWHRLSWQHMTLSVVSIMDATCDAVNILIVWNTLYTDNDVRYVLCMHQ